MLYLNPISCFVSTLLYFSWVQFLWQREDVQWGGWQGAGGGHLHGRGLLPEAAAHGLCHRYPDPPAGEGSQEGWRYQVWGDGEGFPPGPWQLLPSARQAPELLRQILCKYDMKGGSLYVWEEDVLFEGGEV